MLILATYDPAELDNPSIYTATTEQELIDAFWSDWEEFATEDLELKKPRTLKKLEGMIEGQLELMHTLIRQ